MIIRKIASEDIEHVTRIYNHYIATTVISFEEEPISVTEMTQRIDQVSVLELPWLVADIDGKIVGYAYASQWKTRSAYRFTTELSIYLDIDVQGQGIGKALCTALLDTLKNQGIKNVVGTIALPNPSSIALHERMGFKKVGEFSNVGFKFDQQISIGCWQLELNP